MGYLEVIFVGEDGIVFIANMRELNNLYNIKL